MQKSMMEMSKPKRPPAVAIVGLVFALLSLGLQTAAVATPRWMVSTTAAYGMWQYCVSGTCSGQPDSILTDLFQVARGLVVLSVLLSAMSSAVGFVIVCVKERVVSLAAAVLALLAAVTIMTVIAIFVADSSSSDYGYSFYLSVAACVVKLTAGALFIVTAKVLNRRGQQAQ